MQLKSEPSYVRYSIKAGACSSRSGEECPRRLAPSRRASTFLPNKGAILNTCSIGGCGRKHKAKGLCSKHYTRMRVRGDAQYKHFDTSTAEEKFPRMWEESEAGCWRWTGGVSTNGYSRFYFSGNRDGVYGHRWSYEYHKGPIPDGAIIDHLCFNRSCVNPDHLRLATATENARHLSGPRSFTKSGLRNVHWNKSANKWAVMVRGGKNAVYGGVYSDLDEAAKVAEKLRREEFGEFAGNA